MEHISKECQKTWHSLIESTNMSRYSKKAWSTIGKLRGDPKAAPCQPSVTANQVAHQLLLNGKNESKVQTKIKLNRKKYNTGPGFTRPFTLEELEAGISTLKPGKAIGLDNIATGQIKNLGPVVRKRLLALYNNCLTTRKLPNIWKKAHVTALPKPEKDPSLLKNYRPISLLSHISSSNASSLLELTPVVDEHLIPEQAGFRPGKSTTSQVLNLTQHIENGVEEGMVTGVVFVDL